MCFLVRVFIFRLLFLVLFAFAVAFFSLCYRFLALSLDVFLCVRSFVLLVFHVTWGQPPLSTADSLPVHVLIFLPVLDVVSNSKSRFERQP